MLMIPLQNNLSHHSFLRHQFSLPMPTIQQSKTSELHQKIAKTAAQLINNNFTPEVLKVSTLTGKNKFSKFDEGTIETIKHRVLLHYGATLNNWTMSFGRIQTLLREQRKKLKKV